MIRCALDEDDCISLLSVLRVVNQVNQEQAWAACFQLAQLIQRLSPANCVPIESLAQIYLHKEGFVHEKSLRRREVSASGDTNDHQDDDTSSSASPQVAGTTSGAEHERRLVASVGIALFWALDYGIPDDEERKLSNTMECLIVQSQSDLSASGLIEVTINRLPHETRLKADTHYRNICKSLVSDTIELSIFLEKIYTATMVLGDINLDHHHHSPHKHHHLHECDMADDGLGELSDFGALRINDWARLWMQVIRELRQRGRFKQALAVN